MLAMMKAAKVMNFSSSKYEAGLLLAKALQPYKQAVY
jgi:hypothetical protein